MRLPFPRACRGKGGKKKSDVKSRGDSGERAEPEQLKENPVKRPYREQVGQLGLVWYGGEGQRPATLKENPGQKTLPGTCIDHEPGKELSQTPILWQRQLLFCLAFLGECFCPNMFLFVVRPQAAKGREQSSPAAAGSLCLNEQSSPAPPARSA